MSTEKTWPKKTAIALNVAFGVLFAVVAAGPVGDLLVYRPAFGLQSTIEAAILFVAVSAAFFFGAWVLFKAWPKKWVWQLVPLSALTVIALLFS